MANKQYRYGKMIIIYNIIYSTSILGGPCVATARTAVYAASDAELSKVLVPVVFTRFDDCENLPLAASGPAVDIPNKSSPLPAYQQAGDLPVASSSGVVTLIITCCHDEKAVAARG